MTRPSSYAARSLRTLFALLLAAATAAATGCAGPSVRAETARQQLAVAEAQYTAAVRTAIDLYRSGVLTREQAAKLHPLFLRARAALDAAHAALRAGVPQGTVGYLRVTNELLIQIRQMLQEAQQSAPAARRGGPVWVPPRSSKLWT